MSGVAIVRYLLAHNSPLLAAVAADHIMAGALPLNTHLPAISVTEVSGMELKTVAMNEATKQITEHVQVSVLASAYPSVKSILALVRAALPLSRGTVNGVDCDSILHDMEGPDIYTDNPAIYFQSQDFVVRFNR